MHSNFLADRLRNWTFALRTFARASYGGSELVGWPYLNVWCLLSGEVALTKEMQMKQCTSSRLTSQKRSFQICMAKRVWIPLIWQKNF